jgi:hypothetical protein
MTEPKVFGISQLLPGYHHDVFSSLHVVSFAYKAGIGKVIFGMFGEDTHTGGVSAMTKPVIGNKGTYKANELFLCYLTLGCYAS